jgi:hypothetical protein
MHAVRDAAGDEEVPHRIRRALAAVAARSEDPAVPVAPLERRLWGMLPGVRAGRANEAVVLALAITVTR